jgi:hypothetical protein
MIPCTFCAITHSLTHWALLEKPSIVQLLKNFPAFYVTRRFIIVFRRAIYSSLFWARSIQSLPSHLSKIHFNIVYPPTSWSSQWLFPSLSLSLSHQYPICNFIFLDLIILIMLWEGNKLWSITMKSIEFFDYLSCTRNTLLFGITYWWTSIIRVKTGLALLLPFCTQASSFCLLHLFRVWFILFPQ